MLKKIKNYLRRKYKTNLLAKKSSKKYRCIVNKSNKYNYVMVIDNSNWNVIVMKSDKWLKWTTKLDKAKELWLSIASILKEKKCVDIVFDRNWYLFHWRIKAIADWLKEWGINL